MFYWPLQCDNKKQHATEENLLPKESEEEKKRDETGKATGDKTKNHSLTPF